MIVDMTTDSPMNHTNPREPKKRNDRPRNNRNVIWYNPPFSLGVRSNIGAQFLGLANQCFPEKHPLRTIFNKNNPENFL